MMSPYFADGLVDHVGHVLDEVEEVHLRDRDVAGVGEVGRIAGLHRGGHLAEEVAERFRVGRRDVELGIVGRRKLGDRVAEQGLRRLEILGAVDDRQLARRALWQRLIRVILREDRQSASRDEQTCCGGPAQQVPAAWLPEAHGVVPSRKSRL